MRRSDGSAPVRSIYWPKGSGTSASPVNYWIDPSVEASYVPAVQNALTQWNNDLSANAPGTFLIYLAQVTSPAQAQVTISEVLSEDGDEGGTESFGAIPTGKPLDQTYLETATITIDPPALSQNPDYVYGAVAHEIGHSLGLQHNQYASSVMFPSLACVVRSNQALPNWDTSYLESVYDPYFVQKCHCCDLSGKHVTPECPLSRIRRTPLVKQASLPAVAAPANTFRWLHGQGYQGVGDGFGTPERISRDSRNGSISVHFHDHSGSSNVSLQSLYLMSSLVARVKILPATSYYDRFPFRTAIRQARIEQIFRHRYGPNSRYRIGDVVSIVDRQPAYTGVFADDPPLDEGSDVVVFLKHARKIGAPYDSPLLHVPSLPQVCKIGLDPKGFMYVAGSTDSQMAAQVNSLNVTSLMQVLLAGTRAGALRSQAQYDERQGLAILLRARGISTLQGLATYERLMTANPSAVRSWALQEP